MSDETIIERHDLKGPDLDVFEIGANGEKRPLPDARERARRFEAERTDKSDRAILDDYHDLITPNHQAEPTNEPDADERYKMERAAYKLITEFPAAIERRLKLYNLFVKGLLRNATTGDGYVLYVVDREGRHFDTELRQTDTLDAFYKYGDRMGIELVSLVEARILNARKCYFERGSSKRDNLIISTK